MSLSSIIPIVIWLAVTWAGVFFVSSRFAPHSRKFVFLTGAALFGLAILYMALSNFYARMADTLNGTVL